MAHGIVATNTPALHPAITAKIIPIIKPGKKRAWILPNTAQSAS